MKVAVATEDGTTISQHFGKAPYYVVVDIDASKVSDKETRPKAGHHSFPAGQQQSGSECGCGVQHGYGAHSESKHAAMAQSIQDCQVVICGGMGWGAYESMKSYNIEAIVTDKTSIDDALNAYAQGNLPNLMDRLH
jgi:predicted Fe-Mo cluster-binding NifX family protein